MGEGACAGGLGSSGGPGVWGAGVACGEHRCPCRGSTRSPCGEQTHKPQAAVAAQPHGEPQPAPCTGLPAPLRAGQRGGAGRGSPQAQQGAFSRPCTPGPHVADRETEASTGGGRGPRRPPVWPGDQTRGQLPPARPRPPQHPPPPLAPCPRPQTLLVNWPGARPWGIMGKQSHLYVGSGPTRFATFQEMAEPAGRLRAVSASFLLLAGPAPDLSSGFGQNRVLPPVQAHTLLPPVSEWVLRPAERAAEVSTREGPCECQGPRAPRVQPSEAGEGPGSLWGCSPGAP